MHIFTGSSDYETNEELLSSGLRYAEMLHGVGWQLVTGCQPVPRRKPENSQVYVYAQTCSPFIELKLVQIQ
jgi:hypothetical protein